MARKPTNKIYCQKTSKHDQYKLTIIELNPIISCSLENNDVNRNQASLILIPSQSLFNSQITPNFHAFPFLRQVHSRKIDSGRQQDEIRKHFEFVLSQITKNIWENQANSIKYNIKTHTNEKLFYAIRTMKQKILDKP